MQIRGQTRASSLSEETGTPHNPTLREISSSSETTIKLDTSMLLSSIDDAASVSRYDLIAVITKAKE